MIGLRALSHSSFRALWGAIAASALGDRITVIALALYLTQEGGPRDVGIVLAAGTGSLVAFLLLGGVWADRLPRRRVMLVSDFARALLHGTLALLIFAGAAELWAVVAIEIAFGAASAFFIPAHAGYLPQTLPPEDVHGGWAATGVVNSVAELLGPVLATALVLGAGPGLAFALDASLFLLSAALLTRARPLYPAEPAARVGVVTELREGWEALRTRRWAWTTVLVFSIGASALYASWLTLGPTAARDGYGSAGAFGAFVAVMGAGTLVGTALAVVWRPLRPLRAGYAGLLPGLLAVPAFALGAPTWAALPLAFAWGVGEALFDVSWSATLARHIPGRLLSRVTALDWIGSVALMPVGVIAAGVLGEHVGTTPVLLTGAIAYAAAVVAGMSVRESRQLHRDDREPT